MVFDTWVQFKQRSFCCKLIFRFWIFFHSELMRIHWFLIGFIYYFFHSAEYTIIICYKFWTLSIIFTLKQLFSREKQLSSTVIWSCFAWSLVVRIIFPLATRDIKTWRPSFKMSFIVNRALIPDAIHWNKEDDPLKQVFCDNRSYYCPLFL